MNPPNGEVGSNLLNVLHHTTPASSDFAISKIFERGVLRDPNLQDITLTVTEVKMSNDLKSAVAFVVPMGSSNQDQIIKGLNHASFFVRKKITEFITLKFLPKIIFRIDNSIDKFRNNVF